MNESTQQPDPLGTLALRQVAIDTYKENVAYMHRDCEIYRAEGFQALSKIEVSADGQRIYAVLNVVDDSHIVAPGQLGLSEQAFSQLGLPVDHRVKVAQAE
ncbi:MAG: thymidine phosphorylase, partial [Gammaproteobacteria bacterium]